MGLFKSSDGGVTWRKVDPIDRATAILVGGAAAVLAVSVVVLVVVLS